MTVGIYESSKKLCSLGSLTTEVSAILAGVSAHFVPWEPGTVAIYLIIIHQIFSLARDWPKHVTWPNIPQLKLGNFREYSPIFKPTRVAEKIWRIMNPIASICGEKMLGYLSVDIICSEKRTVFRDRSSRKSVSFEEQIMSADKHPCIFSRQMTAIVYISSKYS